MENSFEWGKADGRKATEEAIGSISGEVQNKAVKGLEWNWSPVISVVSLCLGRKERTCGFDHRFLIWTTPVDPDPLITCQ